MDQADRAALLPLASSVCRIWADPGIQLTHFGEHAFRGDPMGMFDTAAQRDMGRIDKAPVQTRNKVWNVAAS